MEIIPATDSSMLQCYVFRTLPGVRYRVESSHDLAQWNLEDEIYGLGHEYVVSMFETAPPPPPEPGSEPPAPLVSATKNVSLFIQPSSGAAGGTMVSWVSLDHGGPVSRLLPQSMTSGWSQMPLFFDHFGDFSFFILHGTPAIPPSADSPPLDAQDAAMFAELENSFAAMNLAIDNSVARARNAPPPAPSDPEARKFWRVHCDLSVDTDQDGTPDWAEFEMAANGTGGMVAGVTGNAFNADINNDGIADGGQLDSDRDGVADALDIALSDASATFEIGPLPRYAVFPITNAQPESGWETPYQISDKGTVLYKNGTWTAGVWTALPLEAGDLKNCFARAINDHNVILGGGRIVTETEDGHTIIKDPTCYWPSPTAAPQAISAGGIFPTTSYDLLYGRLRYGLVLSNDGKFLLPTYSEEPSDYSPFTYLHIGQWKLPAEGQAATESPATDGLDLNQEPDLKWGVKPSTNTNGDVDWGLPVKGQVCAPELLPELPFPPLNVARLPESRVLAMPDSPEEKPAMVWYDSQWHVSPTYAKALDISADGTAIGKSHGGKTAPVLLNGKWTDIKRTAPGATGGWNDASVTLLDTTPGGWILAERGPELSPKENAVMLPLRVEEIAADPGFAEATGVDAYSIACPDPGAAVMNRIWIMAPTDGNTTRVTIRSPLNSGAPIHLSAPGIKFDNKDAVTIDGYEKTFEIKASDPASTGQDIPLTIKMGAAESVSQPVGVKIMKARLVKVAIHPVASIIAGHPDNVPGLVPTKAQTEDHLNKIYGPQINTRFAVTINEHSRLDWDNATSADFPGEDSNNLVTPGNGYLDFIGDKPRAEENVIDGALRNPTADINIYILGGGKLSPMLEWYGVLKRPFAWGAYGFARPERNMIFIDGDIGWLNELAGRDNEAEMLHTLAHEIGHCLVKVGHPDQDKGSAPLKDLVPASAVRERLMVGDNVRRPNYGVRLVKGEWDAAEEWLSNRSNGDH